MIEILFKLLPVFVTFFIGYICKQRGIFSRESGTFLLKLIFFVTSPFLAYRAFSQANLEPYLFAYTVIPIILVFAYFGIAKLVTRKSSLKPHEKVIVTMAYMIMNIGFALAFIIVLFGDYGVVRYQMFAIATNIMTFGWVYSIAVRNGENKKKKGIVAKKLLLSPPLWGLLAGIVANFTSFHTPDYWWFVINPLADMTAPIIMLALGILFTPQLQNLKTSLQAIAIRIVAGFSIGFALATLFGLTGIDKTLLLMLASAPIGFNVITFASLEKLDESLAVQIVSIGILVALIWYPVLLAFFPIS